MCEFHTTEQNSAASAPPFMSHLHLTTSHCPLPTQPVASKQQTEA